jgi:hypothetical protein
MDGQKTEISDWADITHTDDSNPRGGTYTATDRKSGEEAGHMSYFFLHDDEHIQFKDIHVEEKYRHRRVATALLRHLNFCHPTALINPGVRNEAGEAWMKHILATEKDKVATNGILSVPLARQVPNGFAWGGVPSAPGT